MKRIITLIILLAPFAGFSQVEQSLGNNNTIIVPKRAIKIPVDSAGWGNLRIINDTLQAKKNNNTWNKISGLTDSSKIRYYQLVDITDSITAKGDRRYPLLNGSYPNASFIPTLSASKIFGLSQVALDGEYGSLSGLPNLSLYYLNSNPNGYISGVTKGMIVASLGFVPADSSSVATYNAGYALTKNGTTFNVDSVALANQFMANSVAADSISSMKKNINGKVDNSRTITINGMSQNLSDNRTWNIPTPVNADWNSNSGSSLILNKPILGTSAYMNSVAFATAAQGALAATALQSEVDGSVTNEIQTIFGNGRTINLSLNGGSYTFPLTAYDSLIGKPTIPTNTNQLTNGSGYITSSSLTWSNITGKPTIKRTETYSGVTNASGLVTVTFGTSFAVAPNIQANIINGADNQNIRITSITTTGATVLVRNRVDVIGLLPTWNNASGMNVDILITEK